MNSKSNQYDFSQPSTSGKPGFEAFQSEKNGLHYFHFNDKKGVALLFSQAYQSAENRERGVAAVKKNAPDRSRYEIRTEKQQFFFVLKAGNNQEIARSRMLDTKLALDKAIDFLAGFSFSEAESPVASAPALAPALTPPPAPDAKLAAPPAVETAVQPAAALANERELDDLKNQVTSASLEKERLAEEVKKLSAQIEQLKKSQASKPKQTAAPTASPRANKDAFRLEFFHEKDEPARGVIEHLYSEKKLTFKGLDWASILNFVAGYVWRDKPEGASLLVQESTARQVSQAEVEAMKKSMQEMKAGKFPPAQVNFQHEPARETASETGENFGFASASNEVAAPTPESVQAVTTAPDATFAPAPASNEPVATSAEMEEPVDPKIPTFKTASATAPSQLFKTGASIFFDLPAGQPVSQSFLEATILPVETGRERQTVSVNLAGERIFIAGLRQPGVFKVLFQSRRQGSAVGTASPLPGSALVRVF